MAKQNLPVWDLAESVVEHSCTTLLHGPSGTGESHAAHGVDLVGRALYRVTLTPETPAAELRGHHVPVGSEFRWQDGPAIRAWRGCRPRTPETAYPESVRRGWERVD